MMILVENTKNDNDSNDNKDTFNCCNTKINDDYH